MFGRRNSLDYLANWTSQFCATKVVIASGCTESALVERAFAIGARGFVYKEDGPDTLLQAVKAVLRGETFVPADLVVAARPDGCQLTAPLSPRESEVFSLLRAGKTYHNAGLALNISERTIEKHATAIRSKLGIKRPAQRIPWTKLRIQTG